LDPALLSRQFKIQADHSYRAGEPRAPRSGIASPSVHAESYWLGSLEAANWPPDISFPEHAKAQIPAEYLRETAANSFGWALSLSATRFFQLHAELLRRIKSEGGQVSLLVALSASAVGSFSLLPEVSRVFGDLGITVEFEFDDR
jgi:hypothetical protein